MFEFWREATATSVPGLLCQSGRRPPENVSILSSLFTRGRNSGLKCLSTGSLPPFLFSFLSIFFPKQRACSQVISILPIPCHRRQETVSQSPSLLISGSGSWPQREARSLARFCAENSKSLPLSLRTHEKF